MNSGMRKYYLLRAIAFVLAPLPPWLGTRVTDFFTWWCYLLGNGSRAALLANLRRAAGPNASPEALRRMARASFRTMGRNYYDLFRIPRLRPTHLDKRLDLVGLEHLQGALAQGRGAVLATAHLGNLDLVAQAALARGVRLTVLVERFQPEKLWRYCMALRTARGLSFQAAGPSGVKAALQALRRGEAVAIACDRTVHGRGVVMDFLGEPAEMPVGAAELALRTGAALLPAFCVRQGRERYRVTIEPPILMPGDGARPTDDEVHQATGRVIAGMERYIKAHPEQWMAFQPIWDLGVASGRPPVRPAAPVGV